MPRDRESRAAVTRWGVLLLLLSQLGGTASAQKPPSYNPTGASLYGLQLFKPAIDTKGYITVNASQVLGLWDFSFGLVGTLAHAPLTMTGDAAHLVCMGTGTSVTCAP